MGRYELTFEVGSLDDDVVVAIYDRFDALVATHGDVTLLTVTAEGPTAVVAGKRVVRTLEDYLRVVVRRSVEDLVTRDDIANRCDTTVEAVDQWIRETHQEQTGFPARHSLVSGGIWLWGEVNDWLRRTGKPHDDNLDFPYREDHDKLNLWLKEDKKVHQVSRVTAELQYSNDCKSQRTHNDGVFAHINHLRDAVFFKRVNPETNCA
jgi:hypothetical protein